VLGAPTGAGKTEFCANICVVNAKQGRKITYFALECEDYEIENRLIYKEAAHQYYQDKSREHIHCLDFSKFVNNLLPNSFKQYVKLAEQKLIEFLGNVEIFYKRSDFTIETMKAELSKRETGKDLIIIDHINFFDIKGQSENEALTQIVHEIRQYSMKTNTPIVLISQLRKSNDKRKQLLPDIEDIHGTAQIIRTANKVILMAQDYENSMNFCSASFTYCLNEFGNKLLTNLLKSKQ